MNAFGKVTIAIAMLVTASCASAPPQNPTVNVTGQWVGEWVCSRPADGSGLVMMKLVQSGSQVTGSAHVTNPGINRTTEGLTGNVSGDQFTPTNFTDLGGSFTVSGDKMAGDFRGVACGGRVTLARELYQGELTRSRLRSVSATVESIDTRTGW
jgi:hypothetical protein